MAKFYNNRVKTGKLAGSVFAIRNGETIERAYQPVVANPSTPAQRASRARLKLLSQLSAIFGNTVAIPRQGLASPRNMFVKKNYVLTSFASDTASVEMENLQLTKSAIGFVPPVATRQTDPNTVQVSLAGTPGTIDSVVYVVVSKGADDELRLVASVAVADAGNGTYPTTLNGIPSNENYVYAYGVRFNSEAARARYGELTCPTASDIANIVVTLGNSVADMSVTETTCVALSAS